MTVHFSENINANFGREVYHVDLEGEASLMTGDSMAALSLLSPLTCIHAYAMLLPPEREYLGLRSREAVISCFNCPIDPHSPWS